MATLPMSSLGVPCPKLSSLTSSETVNPIPPSTASPKTSIQARSGSSRACRSRVTSQVAPEMPIALPTTRPKITPKPIGLVTAATNPLHPPTATPAEKKAKTGTATLAENGRTLCSRISARPCALSSPRAGCTGTPNASSTPATVACTPELYASAQATNPIGTSSRNAAQPCLDRKRWPRWATRANSTIGTRPPSRYSSLRSRV